MKPVFTSLLVLLLLGCAEGLRHDLKIKKDSRHAFFIENFGFEEGGILSLTVTDFMLYFAEADNPPREDYRVGFLIGKTQTDNSEFVEETSSANCLFDMMGASDFTLELNSPSNWTEFHWEYQIPVGQEGLYNIYFANCEDPSSEVSFRLELVNHNPGPDFLSAGESPLPTVYVMFFFVFLGMVVTWGLYMRKQGTLVYKIHHLMTVVIVLKMLTMLFLSLKWHYMKLTGHGSGWNVVYYIFASLKGVMMFVVIALIGTGWAFIKPYLSDKDKKIFLVVIPLQLLDNVAMIVIDETAPGSRQWLTWYDILRLVDIICCGAILFPIVWSIKHLRDAAGTDGKAARNMEKLKLFRQFYIMVVAYIYFTRIIVYLLDATLPFRYVWLSHFCAEAAAVLFYGVTGHKFRPVEDNPYLKVSPSDEDEGEAVPMDDVVVGET